VASSHSPNGSRILEPVTRAKVARTVARIEQGNPVQTSSRLAKACSNTDRFRADSGSIFGRDGETLVILLTGGTKKRQQRDIESGDRLLADYRRRKGALR